ncbi:RadC family protein [Fusibacillus kribbianus]|uniref:DNA repair protein RadC n=1 Tax=Fusibacillus kribbianus TaxID=3044208 RepID=A0AAP4BAQ4_9FIRM|nr:DNA repair protein RadC [Ruminococcus sp. YH-rum2234]MDI9242600.1 DNA repair protein RadC [Ruminococcus sp. YH-rum2234]
MNRNTIRELPASERPYEKCRAKGPESLTDAELLAVILRTGTKGQGALETARKVLDMSVPHGGLLGLYHLTADELRGIPGIGSVKALQLSCIGELAKRMSRNRFEKARTFGTPGEVASYFMEDMRHLEKEELRSVFLDTKGQLLKEEVLFVGTVNGSLISPREIFLEALKCRAVSVILLHNHPSGDPEPSREDILVTKRIAAAGELLDICLLDHIIIGDHCYISLKERGIW